MIDWLLAVHVVKKTPVRKRSTAIGQTEFAGASARSVVLKPAEPRMRALQLAFAKVAASSAPARAPSPKAAPSAPKTSAPTCSVFDARTGTSTWKLNPTVETTVVISRTRRIEGVRHT